MKPEVQRHTRYARQHRLLVLEQQMHALATQDHGRLDKAAEVIGALQRQVGTVESRLSLGAAITEDQAAEVSNRVKALSHLLSCKEKGKNHYQGMFGELYRRFGVTSYTHIPQRQYAEVLAFLEEWRQAVAYGKKDIG